MKKLISVLFCLLLNNQIFAEEVLKNLNERVMYHFSNYKVYQKSHSLIAEKLTSDNKIEESWEITSNMLRNFISEDECIDVGAELCSDLYTNSNWYTSCVNYCLFSIPQFIAMDVKLRNIYFYNQIGLGGSGGAYGAFFVGDFDHKKITKLGISRTEMTDAVISPTGQALAIAFGITIHVFNVTNQNDIEFNLSKVDTQTGNVDRDPFYSIQNLKWLDENHLEFNEEKYINKWSTDKPIAITKKIIELNYKARSARMISEQTVIVK